MDKIELTSAEASGMQIGEDQDPISYVPFHSLRQMNLIYSSDGIRRVEVMMATNKRFSNNSIEEGTGQWTSLDISLPVPQEVQSALETLQNFYATPTPR